MPIHIDPDQGGLLPEGVHRLTVDSVDQRKSSAGNDMLVVELSNEQGKSVTDWIVLRPDLIAWKFQPLWEAAGLAWPEQETDLDEQDLVDKELTATIVHQRRDGFLNARIENYHPVGDTGSDIPGQETFDVETPSSNSANAIDEEIPF